MLKNLKIRLMIFSKKIKMIYGLICFLEYRVDFGVESFYQYRSISVFRYGLAMISSFLDKSKSGLS